MKSSFLAFIIAITFITNTHSQEDVFRVVVLKNGTTIAKDSCFDSITYTMHNTITDDTLSELIVGNLKCKFGQKISQCFHNGYDTLKIVLKDSTPLNAKTITVHSGTHMSSTTQFALSAKKYKYGEIKLADDNWFVIHKGGIIQFNHKIVGPVSLKLLNINGELVHQGTIVPSKNTIQQYSLPSSFPNGYYVLRVSSKAGVSSYSCMVMR